MISIILILLFVFSVLSVPVCHGVISGLYLYGMKIFPGLFISFILTNILVRILQQKNINNPWILVITGLMTGFPNGAYICSWYNKNNPENRLGDMLAGIINIPSPAFLISYVFIFMTAAPLVRLKTLALGQRRRARRKEAVLIRFASPSPRYLGCTIRPEVATYCLLPQLSM